MTRIRTPLAVVAALSLSVLAPTGADAAVSGCADPNVSWALRGSGSMTPTLINGNEDWPVALTGTGSNRALSFFVCGRSDGTVDASDSIIVLRVGDAVFVAYPQAVTRSGSEFTLTGRVGGIDKTAYFKELNVQSFVDGDFTLTFRNRDEAAPASGATPNDYLKLRIFERGAPDNELFLLKAKLWGNKLRYLVG
jgi:hypothetical protein